jgi:quercetin dioxygenase-like cupin family protein
MTDAASGVTDSTALIDNMSHPRPAVLGRQTIVHLAPELELSVLHRADEYWSHTFERPEMAEGRILSVSEYDTTWTWWERHPIGDELLYVIAGEIDLQLDDGVATTVQRLRKGEAAIVPTGAWHRAVVPVPSRLLFVTPTPARTEHRPA